MRKALVVAVREYQAAVRTKSFVLSVVIMPLLMGGSWLIQNFTRNQVDTNDKHFAVIDRSAGGEFAKAVLAAVNIRNERFIHDEKTNRQTKPAFRIEIVPPSEPSMQAISRQRLELSHRVRNKELVGFAEIGANIVEYKRPQNSGGTQPAKTDSPADSSQTDRYAVRYQTNSPTYEDFSNWLRSVVNEVVQQRRFASYVQHVTRQEIQEILNPVPYFSKGLTSEDAGTVQGAPAEAPDQSRVVSFGVPVVLIFLMFMLVMIGATPLMQSILEEKMQRIAEVLLGSVQPFELMMGKLVGMVGVSLTLAALYLGGGYWAAARYGVAQYVSLSVLLWFGIYLVLAVLMFGSLFIVVGAACTDLRETQSMVWPVMLLVCIPMFVWFNVVREPNSTFATMISFFPFATPMLMLGRQAVPPGIPLWQPIAGAVVVLLTTACCVYVAGRIFRVGILMQGKGANLGDLVKWVIRG